MSVLPLGPPRVLGEVTRSDLESEDLGSNAASTLFLPEPQFPSL